MKELSIEEKAKAYDEAIERAKEMIKDMTNIGGVAKVDDIQHIFPELKESVEERIRKAMDEILEIQRAKDILEDYRLTREAMLSLCPTSKKLNTK